MKKYLITGLLPLMAIACGSPSGENNSSSSNAPATASSDKEATDAKRGVGKYTEVKLDPALNQKMADAGQKIYDLKCGACHKQTEEKLVGPGWKGVTTRRTPVWIMNFLTNVDEMLNKDAEAQAMLEICMVRMPNQNLTDEDARNMLELMRKIDGVK